MTLLHEKHERGTDAPFLPVFTPLRPSCTTPTAYLSSFELLNRKDNKLSDKNDSMERLFWLSRMEVRLLLHAETIIGPGGKKKGRKGKRKKKCGGTRRAASCQVRRCKWMYSIPSGRQWKTMHNDCTPLWWITPPRTSCRQNKVRRNNSGALGAHGQKQVPCTLTAFPSSAYSIPRMSCQSWDSEIE